MAEPPIRPGADVSIISPYRAFPPSMKSLIVFIVSIAATFSGLATNIYFPVILTIATELSVSIDLVNVSITSYLVFQAIMPFIWGAFSDYQGRRILSAPVSLEILPRESNEAATWATSRQGRFTTCNWTNPRGVFADTFDWKSIFETLRSLVGNGTVPSRGISKSSLTYFRLRQAAQGSEQDPAQTSTTVISDSKQSFNFLGPIRILLSLEITFAIVFVSICYGLWQMTLTAQSTLLKQTYNLNDTQLGLTYVANGVDCMVSTASTGGLLDVEYKRIKSKYGGPAESFPLERARLRTAWFWAGV
ncbi:hypothetical protein ACJ73_03504 [Blastomyces percursus]|uniref:Major facilitator superfamily (MFS) profile domain-containing protein n=1 Tax=Blastomyces percursus TaxID=1658174 RepID=A0A1J9Q9K0_9EURO|nr:hypothetical protein ACJ73_03504 [Blastomyces percursus]